MRIAYFGLPIGALLLHADGHAIVHASISRETPGMRRLSRILRPGGADLLVSFFWTKKIPHDVLAAHRLGAIGVHPSLLPRHRGADPYFWAIRNGDTETGVTVHRLNDEYDTGDVLARERIAIDPKWNAWTLAKKLDRPALATLRKVVNAIARGDTLTATPQIEADATLAPEPTDDDLEIRWDTPANDIVRLIRAGAPHPGAFTAIDDETVIVTDARVRDVLQTLVPGECVISSEGTPIVRARDSGVEILGARLEEDDAPLDREDILAIFDH